MITKCTLEFWEKKEVVDMASVMKFVGLFKTDPFRVLVFDTTPRDGEQSPGATMNREQKLQYARASARMGTDIIEAGFPVASPGDFEAVQAIATEVGNLPDAPVICALARSLEKDIRTAWEAVKSAKYPRIHVFLATSPIHLKYKLKKAEDEILKQAVEAVRLAKSLCTDIEFSPEDASRTSPQFLCQVVQAVIKAGATTVNIPDTVGYAVPEEYGALIATLFREVPNINEVVISVHCHNDLGMAVANSLAGVRNGARQVECTMNGIGERAGNAALEEVVMALRTRNQYFGDLQTAIDTKKILQTSRLVSSMTGIHVQRNKAIVGENAFSHESGIHQDGMLKERTTYEIMVPSDVGWEQTVLVLGKHSGKNAFGNRLRELGYNLGVAELGSAFERFKVLCDKKKSVYDADLIAIVEDQMEASTPTWELETIQVSSGNKSLPTATISLRKGDESFQDCALGDGPVHAIANAINRIIGVKAEMLDYQVHSVTVGQEAQGEVSVKLRINGAIVTGRAISTDTLEASAKAYLNAVCRGLDRPNETEQIRPQQGS